MRFGHDWDPICMAQDEVLFSLAEDVKNFAVVYLVDISEVVSNINFPSPTRVCVRACYA